MIETKMLGADIRVKDVRLLALVQNEDGTIKQDDAGQPVTEEQDGKQIYAIDHQRGEVWLLEFTQDAADALSAELSNKPTVFVPKGFMGHLAPGGRLKV